MSLSNAVLGVSSLKTASTILLFDGLYFAIVVVQEQLLTVSTSERLIHKNSRKSARISRAHGQRDVAHL